MIVLLLLIGIALTLTGANILTDGSVAVAQRFRVPEFIIGLTIVAIGTSMPELVVSTLSAISGQSDMAIGNVVGSNLFNVLVIIGLCALIRPIALTGSNIRRDIPFGMAGAALLWVFTSDRQLGIGATDCINRGEGIVMLVLYFLLMGYSIRHAERSNEGCTDAPAPSMPMWRAVIYIVGGLTALIGGGELFLRSATEIARILSVSESVIAITLVAGGTSLPELALSLIALIKGRSSLALGNIIGSNLANILLILGLGATISPLTLGSITVFDIGMVVLCSALLLVTAFTFVRKMIDRIEGAIFLVIYGLYIWHLIS